MTYRYLTPEEQARSVAERAHALEAAHWQAVIAALEADADPATDADVAEAKRADQASLLARLDVLDELTNQLRHRAASTDTTTLED